jgi:hypothetical protein
MKLEAILKVISQDLGASDIIELNKIFKAETFNHIKFRMRGKNLGHFGYTANIKNIANDGLKIFLANKVKLIKFEDIEEFEKAKPRSERPVFKKLPIIASEKKPTRVDKVVKASKYPKAPGAFKAPGDFKGPKNLKVTKESKESKESKEYREVNDSNEPTKETKIEARARRKKSNFIPTKSS